MAGGRFTVDVVNETLERSSLDKIHAGDRVNLERAMAVGDRLGGHIMQGHVDGTGVFLSRDEVGLTRFAMPERLAKYVVEKGSIAVDGVSLTVVEVGDDRFAVALIPTTLSLTTLGEREAGRSGQPGGGRARQVRGKTGHPAPRPARGGQWLTEARRQVSDFAGIERAIADMAAGKAVVVVDDEDRENEGDLIFAAEKATPELVAFMVRYTSGYICVPLLESDCDRLDLPPMYHTNQDRRGTAYTVTVDAREGVSTGISATDRAHTMRLLADPRRPRPADFTRPGHVVPLRAKEGGVLRRPGHTEAAVDLARLAGLRPAGVLCELVSQKDEGDMARREELEVFAADHDLPLITIADLIAYRRRTEKQVLRVAEARIPTAHGVFRAVGYDSLLDGIEHVALVYGEIGDGENILVRVHSECLTGDVFGSLRCDCGPQLDAAMALVAAEGRGVVLYVRGHEGRGIGLLHKLQAYQLQDDGARHRGRQPGARRARRRPRLRHRRADPVRPGREVDAAADQQSGQAGRSGGLRPAGGGPGAAAHLAEPGEPALPAHQARPDGPRSWTISSDSRRPGDPRPAGGERRGHRRKRGADRREQ